MAVLAVLAEREEILIMVLVVQHSQFQHFLDQQFYQQFQHLFNPHGTLMLVQLVYMVKVVQVELQEDTVELIILGWEEEEDWEEMVMPEVMV